MISSVQAGNQPTLEKKELANEHTGLTELKVAGLAMGAGFALYGGYNYFLDDLCESYADLRSKIKWGLQSPKDFTVLGVRGIAVGLYLYTAYTLGSKALTRAGFMKARDQSATVDTKEHKIVSGLKATGAAVGAAFGLIFMMSFVGPSLDPESFDQQFVTEIIGLFCGAFTVYKFGYEGLPCYINRIRGT